MRRMDQSLPLARRASAEGIAAFALVFAGCGAVVANAEYDGALGAVGVSLVFGLIIMVMVYAFGPLSGAHINPAVTPAFTLSRHFPARDAVAYIAAQLTALPPVPSSYSRHGRASPLARRDGANGRPARLLAPSPECSPTSSSEVTVRTRPLRRPTPMAHALFVCLHNAGRSQMSQALFERAVGGRHTAASAGTQPGERVHPQVVDAMRELGIDLSDRTPQVLTRELAEEADVVVTMGCGDECPYIPGKRYIDWVLQDPAGLPLEDVRAIRDEIAQRTAALVSELNARD